LDGADVVIVGAGPAGSAAAIACAGTGLNVVLVERAAFPREAPGETLHPGIEPLLERLGVAGAVRAAGFLRHEGTWVRWGGDAQFQPFGHDDAGPWLGFQAPRAAFDEILLERARGLGVTIFQPCVVLDVRLAPGRVVGIETSSGAIVSPYVVDASGRRGWLAGRLGIAWEQHGPPLMIRYGYVAGSCPARDGAPAIVADRDGWTWTARVAPGLYQWTRLSFAGRADDGPPAELAALARRGHGRGADVTWRLAAEPAGGGYFLAGDAAAVLDPASGHGVLRALMSGMMIGHLIPRVAAGQSTAGQVAAAYRGWLREGFHRDIEALRSLYARLPEPPAWVDFNAPGRAEL
jgi:flavin-dependent dehydrogenase